MIIEFIRVHGLNAHNIHLQSIIHLTYILSFKMKIQTHNDFAIWLQGNHCLPYSKSTCDATKVKQLKQIFAKHNFVTVWKKAYQKHNLAK